MTLASNSPLDAAELNASLCAVDNQVNESVQVKLLAWVMGLPAGLDPAMAAQLVISHQTAPQAAEHISAALMRLVEIVAQYPHDRLLALATHRRRRAMH